MEIWKGGGGIAGWSKGLYGGEQGFGYEKRCRIVWFWVWNGLLETD